MDPGFVEALLSGAGVQTMYPDTVDVEDVIRAIEDRMPIDEFRRLVDKMKCASPPELAFVVRFAGQYSREMHDVLAEKIGFTASDAALWNFVQLMHGSSQIKYS